MDYIHSQKIEKKSIYNKYLSIIMDYTELYETKHYNSPTELKIKNKEKIYKEKRKSSKTKDILKQRKLTRERSYSI